MEDSRPLIATVKRGSLDDGPGIRSVVFFKGCPLGCYFCQNPETQDPKPEIAFRSEHCIRCGSCADACPEGAVDLDDSNRIRRDRCVRCGICAAVCPGRALYFIGRYYTTVKLSELLLRDRAFYRHSGGGVTLSGGECTLYPDYVESLLHLLKVAGINIVLETSGYFDYGIFEDKILPYVDLIYYDIKLMDRQAHIKHTGRPNELILENFHRLVSDAEVEVHPRMPLVPGITATRANLSAVADFLYKTRVASVSLLPYNPAAVEMAPCLGRPAPKLPGNFMKSEEEREIYAMFSELLEGMRDGCLIAPEKELKETFLFNQI